MTQSAADQTEVSTMSDGAAGPGTVIRTRSSESFRAWLEQVGGSLVVSTYQAGKLAFISSHGTGRASVLLRDFPKAMGIAVRGNRLALATKDEIICFANDPPLAGGYDKVFGSTGTPAAPDAPKLPPYDAVYLPRLTYHTGNLFIHDIHYAPDGTMWAVNTRFNCLSTLNPEFSFEPRWMPHFITRMVPEDRCHLNGVALVDGLPKYVTALGQTDEVGKWRDTKATGGIVMEVPSGEVILKGLAMPHAPRWYKDKLWVLNSGAGELCVADLKTGKHDVVCALPGYLRGLSFYGQYAFVGMCQIREKHMFGGLPVQERHPKLLCGIAIIDTSTGKWVALFEFTSGVQELYEVLFIPKIRRPMLIEPNRRAEFQGLTGPGIAFWVKKAEPKPDGTIDPPVELKVGDIAAR